MDVSQLTERYLKYMEEYNATLPADMSDADRKVAILKALDEVVEKDLADLVDKTEEDLKHIEDEITVHADQSGSDITQQQLDAIRQSL